MALGYKELPSNTKVSSIKSMDRKEIECDLIFAGLLVLQCPLKAESKKTIKDLIKAQHRVKMITGDNPFTACEVARQVLNSYLYKNQVVQQSDEDNVCVGRNEFKGARENIGVASFRTSWCGCSMA